eukprot:2915401-Rhodomonas_salina.1
MCLAASLSSLSLGSPSDPSLFPSPSSSSEFRPSTSAGPTPASSFPQLSSPEAQRVPSYANVLRICYAVSGTNRHHAATRRLYCSEAKA